MISHLQLNGMDKMNSIHNDAHQCGEWQIYILVYIEVVDIDEYMVVKGMWWRHSMMYAW